MSSTIGKIMKYTAYCATVVAAYYVAPPIAACVARAVVGYQAGSASSLFAKTAGFVAKEHAGAYAFSMAKSNAMPVASATFAFGEFCANKCNASQEEVPFEHDLVDLKDPDLEGWVEVVPK